MQKFLSPTKRRLILLDSFGNQQRSREACHDNMIKRNY